jgi:hypothetical protein
MFNESKFTSCVWLFCCKKSSMFTREMCVFYTFFRDIREKREKYFFAFRRFASGILHAFPFFREVNVSRLHCFFSYHFCLIFLLFFNFRPLFFVAKSKYFANRRHTKVAYFYHQKRKTCKLFLYRFNCQYIIFLFSCLSGLCGLRLKKISKTVCISPQDLVSL